MSVARTSLVFICHLIDLHLLGCVAVPEVQLGHDAGQRGVVPYAGVVDVHVLGVVVGVHLAVVSHVVDPVVLAVFVLGDGETKSAKMFFFY